MELKYLRVLENIDKDSAAGESRTMRRPPTASRRPAAAKIRRRERASPAARLPRQATKSAKAAKRSQGRHSSLKTALCPGLKPSAGYSTSSCRDVGERSERRGSLRQCSELRQRQRARTNCQAPKVQPLLRPLPQHLPLPHPSASSTTCPQTPRSTTPAMATLTSASAAFSRGRRGRDDVEESRAWLRWSLEPSCPPVCAEVEVLLAIFDDDGEKNKQVDKPNITHLYRSDLREHLGRRFAPTDRVDHPLLYARSGLAYDPLHLLPGMPVSVDETYGRRTSTRHARLPHGCSPAGLFDGRLAYRASDSRGSCLSHLSSKRCTPARASLSRSEGGVRGRR